MKRHVIATRLSKKLSKVYGEPVRIAGPYVCKDGRRRVDVITSDSRTTQQLARVRLQIKIGRKLRKSEEVDHIDNDAANDLYDNLQLLSGSANRRKAVLEAPRKKTVYTPELRAQLRARVLGGKNVNVKLTEDKVHGIRHLLAQGTKVIRIAEAYGVAHGTIRSIRDGLTWSHVQ